MKRVAVLRPEPGASRTLERAAALGLDAFALPLFTIEPVEWRLPDPAGFDALLLTSANAVRWAGRGLARLSRLPVHAVGLATAEAARAAGLNVQSIGSGGAAELLTALDPRLRLLHLAGEDRVGGDARVTALAVYRARTVEAPAGLAALNGTVALIHSPRAGRRLAELAGAGGFDPATVTIAAISPAAAAAAGKGWALVQSIAEPDDSALLALAAKLCQMNGEP